MTTIADFMDFYEGGVKYLQKMWEMHIGTWQGWI